MGTIPDQRVAAPEWMAACKKLGHFLRGAPDHPELNPDDVNLMLDMTESALLDLQRTFEERARSTPT